jgi:hypothetical protein
MPPAFGGGAYGGGERRGGAGPDPSAPGHPPATTQQHEREHPADAVTRAGHAVNRTKLPQPVPVKVRASSSPAVGLSGRDGTRRERFASLWGSAAPTLD